jgi:hypothetical protein
MVFRLNKGLIISFIQWWTATLCSFFTVNYIIYNRVSYIEAFLFATIFSIAILYKLRKKKPKK